MGIRGTCCRRVVGEIPTAVDITKVLYSLLRTSVHMTESFTLRPTHGKKIVQVNVGFTEIDDATPQPIPPIPAPLQFNIPQIKPEDIKIDLWTHQNPTITQDFCRKYLTKYINEQIIPAFGKFVPDWLKQANFDFVPVTPDGFTEGNSGSMTVTIEIGKFAKIERFVDYLSAESVKSVLKWMQVDKRAFNSAVNNNFFANKWVSVLVDGVTYHGLLISNTGLKLGEG